MSVKSEKNKTGMKSTFLQYILLKSSRTILPCNHLIDVIFYSPEFHTDDGLVVLNGKIGA